MPAVSGIVGPFKLPARFQVLVIIVAILIAYYPTGFGEFCSIDDRDMVNVLMSRDAWNLKELFIPRGESGLYYRPLVGLSFFIDRFLLNTDANLMHLHSLLLHILNSLLVYVLAHQLISLTRCKNNHLPLLSGLFFGLHPVNTEAVNWISARADVLAGTFILASANFLLLFKRNNSYPVLLLSCVFMIFGLLAKEVAAAFLAGSVLMMMARTETNGVRKMAVGRSLSAESRQRIWFFIFLIGSVSLFLLLRAAAFVSHAEKISITKNVMVQDLTHTAFVILRAFVFYLKKLYFPFPLNFAIIEIDPLYELFIVPVILLCLIILARRTLTSAVFMTGIFLITPSFLIALNEIAWTPYAERYLYLPLAFIVIGTLLYIEDVRKKLLFTVPRKEVVLGLLLVIMGILTFQRSLIWLDSVTLFRDTAEKSPTFHVALSEYAFALMGKGEFQNARTQFLAAKEEYASKVPFTVTAGFFNNKMSYWEGVDLGLAYLLEREGKVEDAAKAFERIYQKTKGQSSTALEHVLYLYGRLLYDEKSPHTAQELKKKLFQYSVAWYDKKGSPFMLYRVGKVHMKRGDRKEARWYFQRAYDLFQDGHDYKLFSRKIMLRLEES